MEASLEAGREVAEKIRRRVESHPTLLETGQSILQTLSLGVGVPGEGDPALLFPRVDECLYLAKRNGRNRVEG